MKYKNMLKDASFSSGVYDKDKISGFGRAVQKNLNGKICYGPGFTRFIDLQNDFAGSFASAGIFQTTDNGRLFIVGGVAAGIIQVAMYTFDLLTGEYVPVGRIGMIMPNTAATTHTPRFIRVKDVGLTGWQIYFGTVGTVLINGGVFLANKIDFTDFQFTPTTIFMAATSDAKAVYKLENPTAQGAGFLITTIMGAGITSGSELLTVKGSASIFSFDGIDTSIAPTKLIMTNELAVVNSGATTFNQISHTLNNNDPVILTQNAPAGFTASPQGSPQVIYFARNVTANTFQLSATSGGVAILGTTVTTPSWTRGFGQSTNQYLASRKTGNINPSFAGTALLTDAMKVINPQNGANAGNECFFFPTSSIFYHFKISGITAGVTAVSGLVSANNLGNGLDYVGLTSTTFATYSDILDKIVYTTAAFSFYMKDWQNNSITHAFGSQISKYVELSSDPAQYFRGFSIAGIDVSNGWLMVNSTQAGQRGVFAMDARSDALFDYSYLISPVKKLSGISLAKFVATIEQESDITDTVQVSIRSANTLADPMFSSASGGWVDVAVAEDLNTPILRYVQIRVKWDILSFLSGIPTQVQDILIGHDPLTEMSEKWKGMADGSIGNATVYRQVELYNGSIPTLYHRGIDDADNVVEAYNTVDHIANFTHSIDEGLTYIPGIGPDQIGKRIKLTRSSPPGVIITDSLKEE